MGGILKLKSHKVPRSASISIFRGGWGWGVFWNWKVKVPRSASISILGGYSETEKSQSAKICLNFNLGRILKLKSHKVPRSASISILGGYSETEKSQSAKICLNFNFQGGWGWGVFWNWKVKVPRSASISIFGGGILKLKSHKVPRSASISILGGYSETEKSQSAKICLNFNFRGGYSETEKSQSAKICLNFNFRGGILKLKSHKVPRSASISIFGGGGGYSETEKSQSAKICLNFNLGGDSETEKSQSAKICLNFNFQGGGYSGVNLWSRKFGPKFTVQPETCLCITVVSHILRMWRLISQKIGKMWPTRVLIYRNHWPDWDGLLRNPEENGHSPLNMKIQHVSLRWQSPMQNVWNLRHNLRRYFI